MVGLSGRKLAETKVYHDRMKLWIKKRKNEKIYNLQCLFLKFIVKNVSYQTFKIR